MKVRNKNRGLAYALGSIVFLLLPICSSPDFGWNMDLFSSRPFLRSFISYVLLLIFFYAQTFVFLPRFYFPKKYILFWLCILASFFICAFIPIALIPKEFPCHRFISRGGVMHPVPERRSVFFLTQYLFQFLVVSIFSYSLHINAQKKRAERARVDAELAYLKAQINPHFLFNTLNSIYALAIQKSDKTADAVVQLSNMMRYVLTEASKDFVPLQKEIEYISDYIALQETRLSDKVSFEFELSGTPGYQEIAPMLLIPFVENAFKYGVNPDEDCAIYIKFNIFENELQLHIFNKKVKRRAAQNESNHVGIENVRRRLMSLYPLQHTLKIKEDEIYFTAFLSIALK